MHLPEVRRTVPRVASAVLLSAAVAVLSVPAAQSASPAQPARPAARTAPTDLYRSQQWTLDALHISRAWKYSRGNGVTVAVLDTGVDGHQSDLSGRVIDGPDFTGHARKPGGRYWGRHGTEMASLIAGHGHGTGASAGVMGVAPDAKILSIRVTWELGDPIRTDHDQVDRARDAVAKGIRYAADHGAQVISMSLGGGNLFYNGNAAEEAAIKYALSKGSVLVASAGNDGNGANRRNYPAAYSGVIAVGAVDRGFKAAKFTNRHTYISVAAPGVEIVSADAAGHGYILGTGTSSSAAFVAGMGALVKARYPNLTPAEVKQALEEGATHRPPDGRSSEVGTGVADAYGALRTAARINKAEHGGTAVQRPQQTPRPAAPPAKDSPDLMLIAVLSGGGTLILLSMVLGWRQRRRRSARDEDGNEDEPLTRTPAPAHSPSETASWERRPAPAGPPQALSPWERRPPEPPAPSPDEMPQWGMSPAEPPPVPPWERRSERASSWESAAAEPPSWEPEPTETAPTESWDAPPAETPSWERPVWGSEPPSPPPAETWKDPSPETPPPNSLEPYEPPAPTHADGNGSNGHRPHDFRVAGGSDPLNDATIDSSSDMGTPLADESWDSIRRGFDRLKDASSWESLAKGDLDDARELPAPDAFDETAAMPIVDPDDEDDGKPPPVGG